MPTNHAQQLLSMFTTDEVGFPHPIDHEETELIRTLEDYREPATNGSLMVDRGEWKDDTITMNNGTVYRADRTASSISPVYLKDRKFFYGSGPRQDQQVPVRILSEQSLMGARLARMRARRGESRIMIDDVKLGNKSLVDALNDLAGFNNAGSSRTYTISADDMDPIKFDLDGDGSDRLGKASLIESLANVDGWTGDDPTLGVLDIDGLKMEIENRAGTIRSGLGWENEMNHHYGFIQDVVGADGDEVDVFINPGTSTSPKVFIVNQVHQKTGKFDEHKCMIGFHNSDMARDAYLSNYSDGWKVGSIKEMTMDEFKAWLSKPDATKSMAESLLDLFA